MLRRRLAAALLALAVAPVAAGTLAPLPAAVAHSVLESSTPADGATVDAAPGSVELTFNEGLVTIGAQVQVTGPGGRVDEGEPRIEGDTVTQPLGGDLPAGDYTITWRVTSADGHPVSGTLGFTATGAAGSTGGPTPAPKPNTALTTQPGPGAPDDTAAPTSGDAQATTAAPTSTAPTGEATSGSGASRSTAPQATTPTSTDAAASPAEGDGGLPAWALWAGLPVLAVLAFVGWMAARSGGR